MSIGIAVMGVSGRMGRILVEVIGDSTAAHLVGATERPGHDWVGRDPGIAMGRARTGVTVTDDPLDAIVNARAVIDFTMPEATLAHADLAAQARAVHVIGTTGFDAGQLARLARAGRHATIVRAGNMSLGVNLLVGLTRKVAAALGPEFDIEVVEAHHSAKVDSPSGTALMLGKAAADGRGVALRDVADRARDGSVGPRRPGDVGFAVVRGGDIVGEHDVIFAGRGERLVLRHVATDRAIFARGALQAALWGQDAGPGQFDMTHVLGL